MKKILLGLAAFALAASLSVQPTMAKELQQSDYLEAYGQPEDPTRLVNVDGTLTLHNITPEQVFAYVSNLENDPSLYPGTFSSQLISGDGGVGSVYAETIYFGGVVSDITVTVMGYKQDHWFKFKSDNLLQNVSAYSVKKHGDTDTELELESFVYVPEGVTQQDMETYMSYVFYNMLTVFNTTGEMSF